MVCTVQNDSWIVQNLSWLIPLCITFVFSVVNIIFAITNAHNAKEQYKAQQIELGVALMQKRLEIYQIVRKILESIINYQKPKQSLVEEFCRADIEIRYLFSDDVIKHFQKVSDLVDKVFDHTTKPIPDGYCVFFDSNRDYETEGFALEAGDLMGESIDLYNKYNDFSTVGLVKKRKKKQDHDIGKKTKQGLIEVH